MVDPTSDLNEDVSEEDAPECETCQTILTEAPNHRVITWIEDDEVQSAHFCNEDCRIAWKDAS